MATKRDGGFLRPKERALLADDGHHPPVEDDLPERPSTTRWELESEVLPPEEFEDILADFRTDVCAVTSFQGERFDENEPSERAVFLHHLRPELERFQAMIDRLLDETNPGGFTTEREALQDALDRLYGDPDPIEFVQEGLVNYEPRSDQPIADELEAAKEEVDRRREGLRTVLRSERLLMLLKYLGEHGKGELPNKQIGEDGEPWRQAASRGLVPELAEKDETWTNKPKYELTDSGRAVLATWRVLEEAPPVERRRETREDADTREIVLDLLSEYFDDFDAINS